MAFYTRKPLCSLKLIFTFLLAIFISFGKPTTSFAATEAFLNFDDIVSEGSGSSGIDVRKDGKIVNYKPSDWFCIDIGKSLGNDAEIRIKLKRLESKSGSISVKRLTSNGTTLGTVNISDISRSSYQWTSKVKLNRTSQKVLCFVLNGVRVQIENIAITRNDDDGSSGGGSGSGSNIQHIGTNVKYDKGDISIKAHSNTRQGDLLLLFVHRTDGPVLKNSFNGWKFLVKCEKHPTNFNQNDTHCDHNGTNTDLGQTIFWRKADFSGEKTYNIDMSGSKPTWAMITTLRNADTNNPMRDSETLGCDRTNKSKFPSVNANKGDLLVMSQSFDDKVSKDKFGAPSGATTRGYVAGSDEAGFLYTKPITKDGSTGSQTTTGSGASSCKDGLISLIIRDK
ncbi:MAG: hypothetical protein COV35_08180 [Alphaproteobacteria bacterium CG11_big_fil_rev_8_21_14_0_20_39_49]|nr:MAG: hypothetical protein COV35_08180 [Alphaproteobacteria bacterium CG11_big_fil_rev_8_21_14_0_20_39_49]